jgi:CelD/BcsL family acetyltransferase involved in cellulose biosynthesis
VSLSETRSAEAGAQGSAEGNWVPRRFSLVFRIGNVHLFSRSFSAKEWAVHFSQLTDDPNVPPPPVEEFSAGLEAAIVSPHPVARRLRALKFLSQTIRYVPAQYRRFSIDLDGSYEDYLKKFSSKTRWTLSRKVRKFSAFCGGAVAWREFRRREGLEEFLPLAKQVSQQSWQERMQGTGLPEDEDFLADLAARAGHDAIRGYVLFHHQRPIAFAYCDVEGTVLVYGLAGFDLEYDRWSPGIVLLSLILQKQFSERAFTSFDFGGRDDWYKEFFATRRTLSADILYFPRHAGCLPLLLLHWSLSSLNLAASRVLEWLRLKALVRRLLRKQIPALGSARRRRELSF